MLIKLHTNTFYDKIIPYYVTNLCELFMYKNLIKAARDQNKKIIVFDLQTTSSIGHENFGIFEVATLIIYPDKEPKMLTTVINPGFPMSHQSTMATGLTTCMVKCHKDWSDVGTFFKKTENSIFVFFDDYHLSAINHENKRYGLDLPKFTHLVDLKKSCQSITGKNETLDSYLKKFNINPNRHRHNRSQYDVISTSNLLDKILVSHDLGEFLTIKAEKPKSLRENRINFVSDFIGKEGYSSDTLKNIHLLNDGLFPSVASVSFTINNAIDLNALSYDDVAIEEHQDMLSEILDDFSDTNIKLNSLLAEVHDKGFTDIDHIQLRVALNRYSVGPKIH